MGWQRQAPRRGHPRARRLPAARRRPPSDSRCVPELEFVAVEGGKHLWVGEEQTYRVLTEIVARLNPGVASAAANLGRLSSERLSYSSSCLGTTT